MSGNAPKKADQGPSSSAAGGASAQPNSKGASNSNEVPHLGVLDEDDEFEEFEVQGASRLPRMRVKREDRRS